MKKHNSWAGIGAML